MHCLPGHSFVGIPDPAARPPSPVASTAGVALLAVGNQPPESVMLPVSNGQGLQGSHGSLGVLEVSRACHGMVFLPCPHSWEDGSCCCGQHCPPPGIAGSVSWPGWLPRWLPFPMAGCAGGHQGPHGSERVPEHHHERGLRCRRCLWESPHHPRYCGCAPSPQPLIPVLWLRLPFPPHSGDRGQQKAGTQALQGQVGLPAELQ